MLQTSRSLLTRLAPPAYTKTSTEKDLAEKAATRKITWVDVAIAVVILADFALSLIDITISHWYIGVVVVALSLYLLVLLLVRHIRPLVGRLLLAGLIASICELFTDASGQYVVHSLTYPTDAPTLWTSPLYMPLSWMVILAGTGYIAWRLRALLGWRKAVVLSGIWGVLQIPLYEEMAYYGGWWRYRPTHLMIGHTPIYVLLFEGLIVAALPLLYDCIERRSWRQVALLGLVLGAWMPVVALVSWLLLGW